MKKHSPSNKALIVIPYWDGDRTAALALSHLLSDVSPRHSDDFDLLFVSRFDATPVDAATIKHVSRKFNLHTYTSKRREVGWPAGCNATFFGSMEWIYRMVSSGKVPGYKFIFVVEGDSIPLSRDCFGYLHREWDRVSRAHPLVLAGAMVPDGGRTHINGGCCLLSGNLSFLKWISVTVGGGRMPVGWDFGLANDFRARGWANLEGIRSLWNTPTMAISTAEHYERSGVVWLHGVKDASLLRFSRQILV